MVELTMWKIGKVEGGVGPKGLIMESSGNDSARDVVSIHMCGDEVVFTEECDAWFARLMKPQDAITALEEAIAWIREQTNG